MSSLFRVLADIEAHHPQVLRVSSLGCSPRAHVMGEFITIRESDAGDRIEFIGAIGYIVPPRLLPVENGLWHYPLPGNWDPIFQQSMCVDPRDGHALLIHSWPREVREPSMLIVKLEHFANTMRCWKALTRDTPVSEADTGTSAARAEEPEPEYLH